MVPIAVGRFAQLAPVEYSVRILPLTDNASDYDDSLTDSIANRLREFGSCHLIAESFSGPIAIRIAALHPELVRQLTLVASVPKSPVPGIARWMWTFVTNWRVCSTTSTSSHDETFCWVENPRPLSRSRLTEKCSNICRAPDLIDLPNKPEKSVVPYSPFVLILPTLLIRRCLLAGRNSSGRARRSNQPFFTNPTNDVS